MASLQSRAMSYDKRNSTCLRQMTISEKFYARKNSSCSDKEGSTIIASLATCNLALSLMNIDTKTMTGNISYKAGATGLGSDMSFLDVCSLDDIARQFANISVDGSAPNLAPVSEYIFTRVSECLRQPFVNAEQYIPDTGRLPLHELINLVKPAGVLSTKVETCNYISGVGNYTNTAVTRGFLPTEIDLRLPSRKCVGLERYTKQSATVGSNLCLYLALAPYDEALCSHAADKIVPQTVASVTELNQRSVDPNEEEVVVADQGYTTVFIFAGAEETEKGVLDNLISRCLRYTRVGKYGPFYREAAIVRIGHISGSSSSLHRDLETITVKEIDVDFGCWKRNIFKYGSLVSIKERREGEVALETWRQPLKRRFVTMATDEGDEEETSTYNDDTGGDMSGGDITSVLGGTSGGADRRGFHSGDVISHISSTSISPTLPSNSSTTVKDSENTGNKKPEQTPEPKPTIVEGGGAKKAKLVTDERGSAGSRNRHLRDHQPIDANVTVVTVPPGKAKTTAGAKNDKKK